MSDDRIIRIVPGLDPKTPIHIVDNSGERIHIIDPKDVVIHIVDSPPNAPLEQVDYTDVAHVTITCKYCGSDKVIKYGSKEGVQRYLCRACQRRFVANNALPGMRYPPDQIASAVDAFYEGQSLSAVQRHMANNFNVHPSDSTVYEWVARFTKQAVAALEGLTFNVGPTWVIDETVLNVQGKNYWFWDIITEPDRFLVASHLTVSRYKTDAIEVLKRGQRVAQRTPRVILSDGLKSYPDAIEQVFGADTAHKISKGFSNPLNTNLIERFHGTLKQRTKVMRGMQNLETARLLLDGWLVHYNFFRPHETLKGKTPGEGIGAKYPFHSWAEVVKHGHIPTERRQTIRITR